VIAGSSPKRRPCFGQERLKHVSTEATGEDGGTFGEKVMAVHEAVILDPVAGVDHRDSALAADAIEVIPDLA
jgi:hypothetical protein